MKSMYEYFRAFAEERKSFAFLFNETKNYSAETAFNKSVVLGNRLYGLGISRGTLVALRAERSVETVIFYFALQMLGATVFLTDPHDGIAEFLEQNLENCAPSVLITDEYIDTDEIRTVICEGKRIAVDLRMLNGKENPIFDTEVDVYAPSTVIFTSGSTGTSKAVVLSQNNILRISTDTYELGWYLDDDVAAVAVPFCHVFGLSLVVTAIVAGYSLFFPGEVELVYLMECIEKYRITRMNGVPSLYYAMAIKNETLKKDLGTLRTGLIGGAPVTKEQFKYIEHTLGITMIPVYGMSECMGIACASYLDDTETRAETVGKFYKMSTGFILDECGNEVSRGEEGEICVSSPAVMLGYFGDEEGTAAVIDEKGRLHTGDLGWLDKDGYVHICGRKKDIIIRNGNNISTVKIERAIIACKGVESVAVVGVKSDNLGEVPAAIIQFASNEYSLETLKSELSAKLSKLEMPEYYVTTEKIPFTQSGKADKMKIKEMFEKWKA